MSVTSSTNRNDYVGNGTASVYSYGFKIFSASDLRVIKKVAGVETTLTITTDYTVTGVGNKNGGNITLVAGNLANGALLTIRRVRPITQESDIRNAGDLYPESIEDQLDKMVMVDQQQQDELNRSAKTPQTLAPGSFDATLPTPTPDGTLVFNPTGTGFAAGPSLAGAVSASAASAAAASASQIAAAASQTAAATSATNSATSATNAATSETNAATSAGAAAAALASAFFRDVVYISSVNSPFTVTQAHNGKLLDIDASVGAVTINLPTIAGLSLPYNIAFKLSFAGNTVTVVRGGTDTIDQINTSTTLVAAGTGMQLVADTDLAPDNWSSLNFATVADASITMAKLAAAVKAFLTPSGSIIAYAGAAAPTGYLSCDGSAVSRTTYSDLFAAIGTQHGVGDAATTFNLPDLRGKFIRGVSGAATNDPDRASRAAAVAGTFTVGSGSTSTGSPTITVASTANLAPGMAVTGTNIPASSYVRVILTSTTFTLGDAANSANVNATGTTGSLTFTFNKAPSGNYPGSTQNHDFYTHTHTQNAHNHGTYIYTGAGGSSGAYSGGINTTDYTMNIPTTASNNNTGGNETRPVNTAILYCIKY